MLESGRDVSTETPETVAQEIPMVITVNRCVGIAWDNKRVSSETVITKGSLISNGWGDIRRYCI
jgi:hypothetical protein